MADVDDVWTDVRAMLRDMADFADTNPGAKFLCDDRVGEFFGWTASARTRRKTWLVRPATVQRAPRLHAVLISDFQKRKDFAAIMSDPEQLKAHGLVRPTRTRWTQFLAQLDDD